MIKAISSLKNSIGPDWPIGVPFPSLWKKLEPSLAKDLYVKDLDETIERCRRTFIDANLGFEAGDLTEILVNHTMLFNDIRTFRFSAGLIDALLETSLSEIDSDLIQTPFETIYLDFSNCGIYGKTEKGNDWHFRGSFLTIKIIGEIRYLCIQNIRFVKDNKNVYDEHYPFGYNLIMLNIEPGLLKLPDEDEVKEMFVSFVNEARKGKEDGFYTADEKEYNVHSYLKTFIELTINGLLYINSVNADVREEWASKRLYKSWRQSSGNHKTKIKHELNHLGKVYSCGNNINIPSMPPSQHRESNLEFRRRLSVRFKVRGHWHRYWTGSRKEDKRNCKVKWIAPFWKGPELADIINSKPFRVKEKK